MKIIIFTGFLGGGKTSLILSLAHYLVDLQKDVPQKSKLVIIENEVGSVGIDDKVLKAEGFQLKELFSGCICCTLSTDLTETINQLADEVNPEWVIIECTGLAYASRLVGTINTYAKQVEKLMTVTVVDAERYLELMEMMPVLITNQIVDGDMILLNKVDLLSKEQILEIEQQLMTIQPQASLGQVSAAIGVEASTWEKVVAAYV